MKRARAGAEIGRSFGGRKRRSTRKAGQEQSLEDLLDKDSEDVKEEYVRAGQGQRLEDLLEKNE